jgi:P-type Cu+ transporter
VIEILAGLALLVLFPALLAIGAWLALARRGGQAVAVVAPDGVQEVEIVVRGRYNPDTLTVRAGVPARLLFNRQEDSPCSDRVIFSDFQQEQRLAPFAVTPVQFIPSRAGEFFFTCAMGMYQGRLLVKESPAGESNPLQPPRRLASRVPRRRPRVLPY